MDRELFFKKWGCELNSCPIDDLFAFYDSQNLLFCQREKLIKSHIPEIKKTWHRLLQANHDLFREVSYHNKNRDRQASMVIWKCTNSGYYSQCAASTTPEGTAKVIHCLSEQMDDVAFQDWFLPDNFFSNTYFGEKAIREIREQYSDKIASNYNFDYLIVRPNILRDTAVVPEIVKVDSGNQQDLLKLIEQRFSEKEGEKTIAEDEPAGKIFIEAEELHLNDINMDQLNAEYREIGLQCTRHIYLAYLPFFSKPVGAIICYRGPFGLNLRFMESRSYLFLNPNLSFLLDISVCGALISKALPHYSDFAPGFIPVITGDREKKALLEMGAEPHIRYRRFARTKAGAEGKYPYFKEKFKIGAGI